MRTKSFACCAVQVVAVALLSAVLTLAAPQQRSPLDPPEEKPHIAILKQINQINPDGSYVTVSPDSG